MVLTRPPIYRDAKKPLTTEQQVAGLQRDVAQQGDTIITIVETVEGLPPTDTLWSDGRPDAIFGTGTELSWSGTGNGVSNTFTLSGRLTTNPTRYRVSVGGVLQPPTVYSLPEDVETLVFSEAPPSGVAIHITAPFYGAAS